MAGEKLVAKALQAIRKTDPLGFYSKGAEEAAALKQAKGTPEQMRAMLLKQGVKPAELENAGFNAAFAGRPSVTKDEIAKLFQERAPKIEEKVSGADPDITKKVAARNSRLEAVNKELGDISASEIAAGRVPAQNPRWKELEKEYYSIVDAPFPELVPTKYSQYQLPGGENYREVRLTLPVKNLPNDVAGEDYYKNFVQRGGEPAWADLPASRRQELIQQVPSFGRADPSSVYRSSHWDEPNVLAHLRMSDRTDPTGRKILHLEELQSDWAQEGRKQGFDTPERAQKIAAMEEQERKLQARYNDLRMQKLSLQPKSGFVGEPIEYPEGYNESMARLTQEMRNTQSEISGIRKNLSAPPSVPSAPYVTKTQDWTDLALKRALREAAEGNYDAIAWTPGAPQAARYPGGTPEEEAKRLKGMIGYYDKMVPTQFQKLARDVDPNAQFGTTNITNPSRPSTSSREVDDLYRELAGEDPPAMVGGGTYNLPSLTITPEMREKIKQGLPLFTAPAIGLGAATQMQSGEPPVADEQRSGFAGGGPTGEAMTIEDILARIRSGGAQLGEFDPRIPRLDASRAFGLQGSKFPNQALPILPTRVIPPEPRIFDDTPTTPIRPAEFNSAPSEPRPVTINRQAPSPTADNNVSRALWEVYNQTESPADFLRADAAMREGRAGGGKAVSKALKAVSEMFDSPGMSQWREGSKIPASRVEDRYFTGTSKDKDFANFNVGRHGAWFTKDPADASMYARENDSKGYRAEGWNMVPVNTADRVIPAFLRSENPFTGPLPDTARVQNYKKAQSDWFDQLRSQGHDAWMPESDPNLAVILRDPSNIKSAISNSGDFDLGSPRIDRASGGHVLSDDYPTSYLPNVGRQVMADGGEAEDNDIRQYERAMAAIARQPEDIRSMTHSPSIPMRPIEIEGGFTGKRQLGNAPYNVAGPMSGAAQFAYDLKTLPFYFTPAAPLALASDTGEAAINMAKSIKKGDYLGAGLEGVLGVAPGAIAFRKPIANVGRQAVDYARSLGRQYADGGSVEQEQPGIVDRAMSFLSQFNPVGSAEAGPISKQIAKQVMRGSDLIAKDPKAAVSQLSERDPSGNVDFGQAINNAKYTFSRKGDLQPWKEFDAQQAVKEKAIIAGILGDRSAAGSIVHDINGVKLTNPVNRFGGGEFQRSTEGPEVWASRPTAVNNMYTRINKGMNELGASQDNPVLAAQVLMGTPAIDSTQMMAKALLRQIEPTRNQINPETAKAFDVAIRKKFPGWPGILNPEEAEQFLRTNEVGKRTSTILQQLDQMKAQEGGLPNLGSARFAMMEPRLVSADQGSTGFAISRLDPRGITNAAAHDTYPTGMLGPSQSAADYMGGTRYQIPLNVMFPDWWKTVKPTYVEKKSGLTKVASPTNIQQSVMTQVPLQRASQEWLDNLMKYTEQNPKKWGYRFGGTVKKQKNKKSAKIK